MSYLNEKELEEIVDTVNILPITSACVGDISQYSFHCGDVIEYEIF